MEERNLVSVTFVICVTAFFIQLMLVDLLNLISSTRLASSHGTAYGCPKYASNCFARNYTSYNCCILQTHVCIVAFDSTILAASALSALMRVILFRSPLSRIELLASCAVLLYCSQENTCSFCSMIIS